MRGFRKSAMKWLFVSVYSSWLSSSSGLLTFCELITVMSCNGVCNFDAFDGFCHSSLTDFIWTQPGSVQVVATVATLAPTLIFRTTTNRPTAAQLSLFLLINHQPTPIDLLVVCCRSISRWIGSVISHSQIASLKRKPPPAVVVTG